MGFLRRLFGEEDAAERARREAAAQGEPVDTGAFEPPGIPGLTGDVPRPADVEAADDDPESLVVERDEGKVRVNASGRSGGSAAAQFVEVLDLPPEIEAARVTVEAEPDTIVIRIPKS